MLMSVQITVSVESKTTTCLHCPPHKTAAASSWPDSCSSPSAWCTDSGTPFDLSHRLDHKWECRRLKRKQQLIARDPCDRKWYAFSLGQLSKGIEGQLVHMKKVKIRSFTLMAKRTHSCPSFPLRSCAGLSLFWLVRVNQCMCRFSVLACSFPFEGSTRWGISVHRSRTPKQITWVQIIVAQSWQKYRLIEFQALFRALFLMTGL